VADLVIFLDIGDTLGTPTISGGHVSTLEPFPFVVDILRRLSAPTEQAGGGHRLGIISNTGTETATAMKTLLSNAGILPLLDVNLLLFSSVEGLTKADVAFFKLAATRAQIASSQCLFVGEDASERAVASKAGFHTAFHLLHAFHVARALGT
jgi:FMN phosphatase YigB (HAD superfamily)